MRVEDVVGENGEGGGAWVLVQSLAALDQPAGLLGVVLVHETGGHVEASRGRWRFWGVGSSEEFRRLAAVETPRPFLLEETVYEPQLRAASASTAALAARIAEDGADVWDVWQGTVARHAGHVTRTDLGSGGDFARLRRLAARGAEGTGLCASLCTPPLADQVGHAYEGVRIVPDSTSFRIAAFAGTPPASVPAPDPQPESSPGSEVVTLARMLDVLPEGAIRTIGQVTLGEGRRVAVLCSDSSYALVEQDGALVRAERFTALGPGRCDEAAVRFADLDGDGLVDVLLQTPWHPSGDVDVAQPGPSADLSMLSFAILRTARIDALPERAPLGVELDMLGAHDTEDALRLARSRRAPQGAIDVPTACALLRSAGTPAGFRASATATARLVDFGDPGSPANATRIVPVRRLRAEDVSAGHNLRHACDPSDLGAGAFRCDGSVCGHFDSPLSDVFRFERVGGAWRLDLALIYVGT